MVDKKTASRELISDEALVHLKTYKYSSVDKSPFSYYVLRHYWNWFVEFLPLWLAPNLVTLLGFLAILFNVGVLLLMVPDLVGPAPSWVYYSFAAGIWIYSTMDNVDGKQARRTGTSSPLGELFDHGIDSLNCTLASLFEVAAMGFGSTKTGAFTAMIPCLPMFFSTWETYHTHTLYLGYFNGPTEGLTIACLFMLTSGYFGPQVWDTALLPFMPGFLQDYFLPKHHNALTQYLTPTTTLKDIWVPFILFAFFTAHLPECCLNVYKSCRAQRKAFLPLLLEWTPLLLFVGGCIAWLGSPHSSLLRDNHLVLFSLTMSLVFGRMTTKIILAHLTRQPFPYFTVLLVPLLGGGVIANLPALGLPAFFDPVLEDAYLKCYFVFAAVGYGRWAYIVINAICNYLGINALTIPKAKQAETKKKLAAEKEGANGSANGTANGVANGEATPRRSDRLQHGTLKKRA